MGAVFGLTLAKDLLYGVEAGILDAYLLQDTIRVEAISKWRLLPESELDPRTYQLILEWIRTIGHTRPANLKLLALCCEYSYSCVF